MIDISLINLDGEDMTKLAYLFPGQGAQYPGMGKDFYEKFALAKETFQEANDILKRDLMKVIFDGPPEMLTETRNSQTAIFVFSVAILRVLHSQFPHLQPFCTAGLSLGEYTAMHAANKFTFADGLRLVEKRGELMNAACEQNKGTMAVVIGLDNQKMEDVVRECNLPNELWAANFNCPGQVVISGTVKGVEAGSAMAKAKGARMVLPLSVHGAFHSGLMKPAEEKLKSYIENTPFLKSPTAVVMNYSGSPIQESATLKEQLIKQVTSPVLWEKGIRSMMTQGVDFYLEIGPGKTLAGMNKKIGVTGKTISIEKVADLEHLVGW